MKKVLGIIAIVLLTIVTFGGFFALSRGTINEIAGFDFRTINEENYIKVDNYTITATDDKEAALQVSIDEDGIITVSGKNETEEAFEMAVTTVTLEKGKYEFASNAKGCSDETYQLVMKDNADGIIVANEEFIIEETTEYTVYIVVYAGAEIDTEFAPVLVDEGESTKFFQNNWNILQNNM